MNKNSRFSRMRRFFSLQAATLSFFMLCYPRSHAAAEKPDDFTFIHVSDIHSPYAAAQSRETIAAIPTTGTITLEPYNISVPAPSFVIASGDLNEFSGGAGNWAKYLSLWKNVAIPIYHQLGNHDNTWDCGRPRLRLIHGSPFYAFEHGGIKFIGWDSATPQDPRPSIAAEGLAWLDSELDATPDRQPIIFFSHHPLDGAEFASGYDTARLLERLKSKNIVLLLAGHGHGRRSWKIGGINTIMGGSTYGDKRGFGIVSIQDGMLRACHQLIEPGAGQAAQLAQLEKPIARASAFPPSPSVSPGDGAVFPEGEPVAWLLDAPPPATDGRWILDEKTSGSLAMESGRWVCRLDRERLEPGAHAIAFEFAGEGGLQARRTVSFWLDQGPLRIVWKRHVPGSIQSTPVAANGRLFFGANDGALYAVDAATGVDLWQFRTAGEARSTPCLIPAGSGSEANGVVFGSSDGHVYSLGAEGDLRWKTAAGAALYSSPVYAEGRVFCVTNGGEMLALDAATGRIAWRQDAAEYAMETGPALGGGLVFAGAWDRYLYATEAQDGALRWRKLSKGSDRPAAAQYYSPADCAPAYVAPNLFASDRAHCLTILDAATGKQLLAETQCSAVSASPDGSFAYLRHTNGRVSKRRPDGSLVWTAEAPTGYLPNPPIEAGGYVFVLSDRGLLSILDAGTGQGIARYQAFPSLFAHASPAFDGERIFVADLGGALLALNFAAD